MSVYTYAERFLKGSAQSNNLSLNRSKTMRSYIQRYEKEADSLTTCTAAWHYQGHVVKDPWSNDYWQPLSFRSHPWSSQ